MSQDGQLRQERIRKRKPCESIVEWVKRTLPLYFYTEFHEYPPEHARRWVACPSFSLISPLVPSRETNPLLSAAWLQSYPYDDLDLPALLDLEPEDRKFILRTEGARLASFPTPFAPPDEHTTGRQPHAAPYVTPHTLAADGFYFTGGRRERPGRRLAQITPTLSGSRQIGWQSSFDFSSASTAPAAQATSSASSTSEHSATVAASAGQDSATAMLSAPLNVSPASSNGASSASSLHRPAIRLRGSDYEDSEPACDVGKESLPDSWGTVKCVFCEKEAYGWRRGETAGGKHRLIAPDCPLVKARSKGDKLGFTVGNIPLESARASIVGDKSAAKKHTVDGLQEAIQTRPQFVHQARESERRITLRKRLEPLPSAKDLTKGPPVDAMAAAGWFYTNLKDSCRCFHCGGGLQRWTSDEDPLITHIRFFPRCYFILEILKVSSAVIEKIMKKPPSKDEMLKRLTAPGRTYVRRSNSLGAGESSTAGTSAFDTERKEIRDAMNVGFTFEQVTQALEEVAVQTGAMSASSSGGAAGGELPVVSANKIISTIYMLQDEGRLTLSTSGSGKDEPDAKPSVAIQHNEQDTKQHYDHEDSVDFSDTESSVSQCSDVGSLFRLYTRERSQTSAERQHPIVRRGTGISSGEVSGEVSGEDDEPERQNQLGDTEQSTNDNSGGDGNGKSNEAGDIHERWHVFTEPPEHELEELEKRVPLKQLATKGLSPQVVGGQTVVYVPERNQPVYVRALVKRLLSCQVCLIEPAEVVLLPCGHFTSCSMCAPNVDLCPVCKAKVMGTARTHLG